MTVYNTLGQQIAVLFQGKQEAGNFVETKSFLLLAERSIILCLKGPVSFSSGFFSDGS
jgi:hypothetical protein